MLSDEEKKALKVVNNRTERLIEELKIEEEDLIDEPKIAYLITQIEANKTLVNLIEKQSKEIEELKEKDTANLAYYDQIYQNGIYTGQRAVEGKIKAKIQECREILYSFEKELELKANKEKYIHKESMNCLLSQISILQSLLEKE